MRQCLLSAIATMCLWDVRGLHSPFRSLGGLAVGQVVALILAVEVPDPPGSPPIHLVAHRRVDVAFEK